MNEPDRTLALVDRQGVEALLDEVARVMAPQLEPETALVGLLRRGAPLARMLAERLERINGRAPEVGELLLKRYGDDLTLLHDRPALDEDSLDIDVTGRHLILVDDVLYTGESAFRAAGFLRAAGASRLQIAVLCARDEQFMPVHAEFVGRRIDVGEGWVIECSVPPYESELGIAIKHHSTIASD
ncbi:phosphoribosyltransferase [Wenzhouxiangella sp. XN201]|uniref:phosphoribosyltransferase family protein n=1 Tax=Wenzhouxiangella sp. XN201 TaxID=2710755 RepID=UPI0013C83B6B|nr:phosphoribosyltransferase family protein [Wenzhouxiangella sp. XN201]NEZ04486.1 phosphoribosyltransferase [Wenzhouxiangella sp. XN201]